MSLKDKASYIFKPSRYKSGTAYAFRGGDLTALRSSAGTRVNASGNIESVASGTPRLNYDPTDLTKDPWILYEDSATNHCPRAYNFAGWTNYSSSLTLDAIDSPYSGLKAAYISGTTDFYISCGVLSSVVTNSIYVKAGGAQYFMMSFGYPNTQNVVFSLVDGSVYSTTGTNISGLPAVDAGNGWWRLAITGTPAGATTYHQHHSCTASGGYTVKVAGAYIWGAQTELVTVPTSIILTDGSTVTRSSDTLYLNSVSSVIGSGQGVVYCDFYGQPAGTGGYKGMFSVNNNSFAYSINVLKAPGGSFYYEIYTGGSTVTYTTYNSSTTTSYRTKMAVYYADNDFGLYINGVRVHTDTGGTAPTGMSSINFNAPSGSYPGTKDIYEFLLFKERLSDEELVALTSFDDYEELVDVKALTWESPTITNNRLSELAAL